MFLTVFTPCYNRARCLSALYNSLQMQSCKEFEWIAIDDGSTDNTSEILSAYAKEKNDFSVRVFYKENGGKHRAINDAVRIAQGKYFFILDSDDYLTKNAVEKIFQWCNDIETLSDYESYAGVSGLKMLPDHSICGECRRGQKFIDASNLQRGQFRLRGDKAEVYKTELLRKYPFKEFEKENFLTEETVWNAIAEAGYKIRWYMEPIYVCEYREDGLTKNIEHILEQNFEGYTYSTKECIRLESFISKIAKIGRYALRAQKRNMNNKDVARKLSVPHIAVAISKITVRMYDIIRKYK